MADIQTLSLKFDMLATTSEPVWLVIWTLIINELNRFYMKFVFRLKIKGEQFLYLRPEQTRSLLLVVYDGGAKM
jgi:hypothetical protein